MKKLQHNLKNFHGALIMAHAVSVNILICKQIQLFDTKHLMHRRSRICKEVQGLAFKVGFSLLMGKKADFQVGWHIFVYLP